jgi:ABC-type lipoprotein export system ATPase subunit
MVVEVEDLVVEYQFGADRFTALDIPRWSVGTNEQVAISGPSGSGKSTLLHVLAGLLPPQSGTVTICDTNLASLSESQMDHFRAGHIGYIFQDFNLLQGYSAIENVLLGMTFSRVKHDRHVAAALLDRVGLSHRVKHRPGQLSIGERQRVAIARALAGKPQLILADEPTGSLDPVHAGEVVKMLKEACAENGCALIVVSHDPSIVGAFARSVPFMQLNLAFAAVALSALAVPAAGGVT